MLTEGYHPPLFWGTNGHMQTLYHFLLRRSDKINFERTVIDTHDGEKIAIDYFYPAGESHLSEESRKSTIPTVIIIPGIAGSTKQHYVKNFANYCVKMGWRTATLNHRGCNIDLTKPKLFEIGSPEDLRKMIEKVHSEYPLSPLYAVGFSMGANILVNYLGKYHDKDNKNLNYNYIPIQGAASISQSYDLKKSCDYIPVNRPIYNWGLCKKIQAVVERNRKVFESIDIDIDLDKALKAKSLWDFDQNFTCKIFDFKQPIDYYINQCCSKQVPKIGVPTLILNALDDPIIPEFIIEPMYEMTSKNEHLIIVTTKFGGHLGFHEGGFVPRRTTWMDRFVFQFFESVNSVSK